MSLEVADVFRRFGNEYLNRYGESMLPSHSRAIRDIVRCRTAAMGGHVWLCGTCGRHIYVYHGCRNRSCPACHGRQTARWLAARQAELLPCEYFHLTATVPEEFRRVFRSNQKALYGLLMQTTSQTLIEMLGDPRHLGATPGILSVLHTWTNRLVFHPHTHCLVTGGGVAEGKVWRPSKPHFLVSVRAFSKKLRGKFKDRMRKEQASLFAQVPATAWKKKWVVNCIPWGQGPQAVLDYLARYVFRIAITNARIVAMDDHTVTFKHKCRKKNRWRTETVSAMEFMRRFLQHVLPKGFHKVRYTGLWHHSKRSIAQRLQLLLQTEPSLSCRSESESTSGSEDGDADSRQPHRCPYCRGTDLSYLADIPRLRTPRGPDP